MTIHIRGEQGGETIQFAELSGIAATAEPNKWKLYPKAGGWYALDDLGNETALGGGVTDHGALTGLADDDHAQYALLAGRATGQVQVGGTGAGETYTIRTTSSATDGDFILQTDPTTERLRVLATGELGLGIVAPLYLAHFERSANAATYLAISNLTAGTASKSGFICVVDAASGVNAKSAALTCLSGSFTPAGDRLAGYGVLSVGGVGVLGLIISTDTATGIRFGTNTTFRGQWTSDGRFVVGSVTPPSGGHFFVLADANAATTIIVRNQTNGTTAGASVFVNADGSNLVIGGLVATPAAFTPTGGMEASAVHITSSDSSGGSADRPIILNTRTGGHIQLKIDGTERVRVVSAGTGVNILNALGFGSLTAPTTSLSEGAANRLDLATGDSLNLVSGALLVAATQVVGAQGAAIADVGAGAVAQTAAGATDTMDKINLILARMRAHGLIAT